MKCFISISLFFSVLFVNGQNIERKIIIENGTYYYTTIDENYQVATMHTGNVNSPLKEETALAMPAGRNYNDPIIPFSWDLQNNQVYAVNFLVNPMNDRMEALKRFSFSSLQEWEKAGSVQDMISLSTGYTPFAPFQPYANALKQSKILHNFYFDGIALTDSTYSMVISNHDQISYWTYNGKYWLQSTIWTVTALNYFTLFKWENKTYMYAWDGTVYKMTDEKMIPAAILEETPPLKDITLVINRDKNSVSYFKNTEFNKEKSLTENLENRLTNVLISYKKK
ncbi:MAG TPA: hypothetical protein VK177_10815 [Flavobacteriales bacterium]|nr:hypothetical protein [Flavobacteriales bacterium]